jgi:hypothetical protein
MKPKTEDGSRSPFALAVRNDNQQSSNAFLGPSLQLQDAIVLGSYVDYVLLPCKNGAMELCLRLYARLDLPIVRYTPFM